MLSLAIFTCPLVAVSTVVSLDKSSLALKIVLRCKNLRVVVLGDLPSDIWARQKKKDLNYMYDYRLSSSSPPPRK